MANSLLIANQNGEELKKAIGSDCAEAYNNEFDTASVYQTKTVTADIKEQTAVNDNNPDGDDAHPLFRADKSQPMARLCPAGHCGGDNVLLQQ